MSVKNKTNNPHGRPPIAKDRLRVNLTISRADYELLQTVCSPSGVPVAAFVRGMIEDARPAIKAIADAYDAQKRGQDEMMVSILNKLGRDVLRQLELLDTTSAGTPTAKKKGRK